MTMNRTTGIVFACVGVAFAVLGLTSDSGNQVTWFVVAGLFLALGIGAYVRGASD
jgi:uncharacterized sodium:solute symporter family permease YidK